MPSERFRACCELYVNNGQYGQERILQHSFLCMCRKEVLSVQGEVRLYIPLGGGGVLLCIAVQIKVISQGTC